eukprot:12353-Heterococcus_DN1.PRE.2
MNAAALAQLLTSNTTRTFMLQKCEQRLGDQTAAPYSPPTLYSVLLMMQLSSSRIEAAPITAASAVGFVVWRLARKELGEINALLAKVNMMQIELDDTLRTAYTGEGSASSASSCSSDNSSPTSTAHANYSLTASSLQATAARVFKRSLIEVYSPNCCESQVHCMVLHKVLPEPTVVAARICRPR